MEESQEAKEETFAIKKTTLWKLSTLILGVLLVISIFTGGFGYGNNSVTISIDDDAVLGKEKAPVAIIEFSDYQCPFCRRSYTQVLPLIKKNFIDTGKARLVFRDFPLTQIHPGAVPAAEAAECAGDQEKYYEMHDKIFDEQNKLGQGTVPFTNEDLKKWAKEIGLDINKFNECFDSEKYTKEIEKDFNDGNSYGVSGTPTYFVGNDKDGYKVIGGAQPYQVFEEAINSYL